VRALFKRKKRKTRGKDSALGGGAAFSGQRKHQRSGEKFIKNLPQREKWVTSEKFHLKREGGKKGCVDL